MQRLFLLVAVMLLSGCLTAPPKEAARPTLMPRAQSYKDLTHLPARRVKSLFRYTTFRTKPGNLNPTRQVTSPLLFRKAPRQCWSRH